MLKTAFDENKRTAPYKHKSKQYNPRKPGFIQNDMGISAGKGKTISLSRCKASRYLLTGNG